MSEIGSDQERDVNQQFLVAVMGCHGVGKSAIQQALLSYLHAIEPPSKRPNPFPESAILSYIHYLVERKKQHRLLQQQKQNIVADRYGFVDTSIYVEVLHNLGHISEDELNLFARILENMDQHWIRATALVVLVCDPSEILERLRTRPQRVNRDFDPFNLLQIASVDNAFRKFGRTGALPPFIPGALQKQVVGVPRILVDCTNDTILEIVNHVVEQIRKIQRTI
jgi:deoxyadenosine/deoxycytidine kinase